MSSGPISQRLDGMKREMREYDAWRGEQAPDEDAERQEALDALDRRREQAGHEVFGGSE